MEDSLVEVYLEDLKQTTNPAMVLERLYEKFFNVEFNKKRVMYFNRFITLYGKQLVFMALLDIFGMEINPNDDIIKLLSYFCKKRVEDRVTFTENIFDIDHLKNKTERINKQKIKIRSPFDE
jgi:hypothetical protein